MTRHLVISALICAATLGCGGAGGSSQEVLLSDTTGKWQGVVNLDQNGCPRELPEEFEAIHFTHSVALNVTSSGRGDLTLIDSDRNCYALNAATDQNEFFAVCPEIVLPGFIEGYECREELVWHYLVNDPLGTNQVNPVIRTSRISCYAGGEIQFVCPVEYSGAAGRCIRDLC